MKMQGTLLFNNELNSKCSVFGNVFKISTIKGYASKLFVETVMTNDKLAYLVNNPDRAEWCDSCFLLSKFEEIVKFKSGETEDESVMWFLGYLYEYWMRTRNVKASEIYPKYFFDRFLACYGFHHTQGWEYIVQDILSHKEGGYIV